QAGWTTSDATLATVDADGNADAVAAGAAVITAAMGGYSDTCALTVTSARLTSIDVVAAQSSFPAGASVSLSASGNFSDGTSADLTTQVVWSSSNNAVATASNAPGSEGTVQGVSAGSVTVFANLLGVSGSVSLTITTAHIVSIAISPASPMLPVKFW